MSEWKPAEHEVVNIGKLQGVVVHLYSDGMTVEVELPGPPTVVVTVPISILSPTDALDFYVHEEMRRLQLRAEKAEARVAALEAALVPANDELHRMGADLLNILCRDALAGGTAALDAALDEARREGKEAMRAAVVAWCEKQHDESLARSKTTRLHRFAAMLDEEHALVAARLADEIRGLGDDDE